MRRRGWRRRAAGWALALLAAGAAGWVGLERLRPPLLIRVTAQEQREAVQAVAQAEAPRVLIYHTHTYEAYQATETENYKPTEKWRTRDENHNMIAVGDALARALTARGFIVVHDTTAFEPPTLSTAYKRSLVMLRTRLDAGERYDYWLDVHRDAYSESYRGANSVETEGGSAARVMLLVGKGTGATGSGFDERPDALLIDGGFASIVAAMTSSHFCTAERQYRMPVLYGNQRTPTAQWTATASGCCILSRRGDGPYITHVTCGRIVDLGIKDANNMGAAMAPAAYDTLSAVLRETHTTPEDYDLILTGDLGELGRDIVADFFREDGIDLGRRYTDCGLLLYDREEQDMHAGASGCGCSAAVLSGYVLGGMRAGRWKRVLFAPTGALLSPTSSFQGESIPGICHAVVISSKKEN